LSHTYATTHIYSLSLHDALPILRTIAAQHDVDAKMLSDLIDLEKRNSGLHRRASIYSEIDSILKRDWRTEEEVLGRLEQEALARDRKSTRLNSSHVSISYAVFCL